MLKLLMRAALSDLLKSEAMQRRDHLPRLEHR